MKLKSRISGFDESSTRSAVREYNWLRITMNLTGRARCSYGLQYRFCEWSHRFVGATWRGRALHIVCYTIGLRPSAHIRNNNAIALGRARRLISVQHRRSPEKQKAGRAVINKQSQRESTKLSGCAPTSARRYKFVIDPASATNYSGRIKGRITSRSAPNRLREIQRPPSIDPRYSHIMPITR